MLVSPARRRIGLDVKVLRLPLLVRCSLWKTTNLALALEPTIYLELRSHLCALRPAG